MSHPGGPELRWAGTEAFLLDCVDLAEVGRWRSHLTEHPFEGQVDVVAAARTVLVVFAGARAAREAASAVGGVSPQATAQGGGSTVEIPVVYDGADLAEVARLTGMSEQGVVEAHTGAAWTAAFGGFAPGFAYLAASGDPLDVPRRDTPRTAVPAGSVALAGTFSAIYPQRSPGGWQLIGRTDAVLWDEHRDPPALIRPGDTVHYRAVRELVSLADDAAAAPSRAASPGVPAPAAPTAADDTPRESAGQRDPDPGAEGASDLVVEDPGMQTLVQDLGRPGLGDLGVVASGAADRVSAAQANRLVGNRPADAVLEVTLAGLRLTARGHHVLALSGAPVTGVITTPAGADARDAAPASGAHGALRAASAPDGLSAPEAPTEGCEAQTPVAEPPEGRGPHPGEERTRTVPFCAPFALYDGEHLTLHAPASGLRSWVAVRGGVDVPEVLGSRATDVMSGIGPRPLCAGDELPVGRVRPTRPVSLPETPEVAVPAADEVTELRITRGPRDDWFTPASLDTLTGRTWHVSSESNRVGVRFETPPDGRLLERGRTDELASEGVAPGSLQVPHSGVPVLFLADHPVTGGYPVVAVVVPEDLPRAAQLAPGARVRFRVLDTPAATVRPLFPASAPDSDSAEAEAATTGDTA